MTDIFHEVEEDLRRERLGKLWNRFGLYIIGLAVLIVVGVAAWRGYEYWQQQQSQAAGARFVAAIKLADEGKHAEAEAAFDAIAKDAPTGYRLLARFRAVSEIAQRDKTAAVAGFDQIAADNGVDPLMRDIARLRAASLLVDTAPATEVSQRLAALDTPNGAFRHSARELTGLAQYKAGDMKAATQTFETILADPATPPGIRSRAELLRTLAVGGTVAAPAAVEAAPAATTAPAPAAPPAGQTPSQ